MKKESTAASSTELDIVNFLEQARTRVGVKHKLTEIATDMLGNISSVSGQVELDIPNPTSTKAKKEWRDVMWLPNGKNLSNDPAFDLVHVFTIAEFKNKCTEPKN